MEAISGVLTLILAIIGLVVLIEFIFLCGDIRRIRKLTNYQSDLLKNQSDLLKTINNNLGTIIYYQKQKS